MKVFLYRSEKKMDVGTKGNFKKGSRKNDTDKKKRAMAKIAVTINKYSKHFITS